MIDQLFLAILETLKQIPGIAQASEVPRRMETVTLPAIFVDLGELAVSADVGTEQLPLIVHWESRLVMPDDWDDTRVWSLVEAVMLTLFNATWPEKNIGRVALKQAVPDEMTPELVGHCVWLIEWTQPLRVGDSAWDGEGVVPIEVIIRYQGSDETTTMTLPGRI